MKELISLLPGSTNTRPNVEDYHMFEDLDIENLNTNEEGGKKEEDEYDEDGGQEGMQCATQ